MNYFDQDKFRNLVKALQQMVRCPQCGGVFSESDVELVAGIGQAYFVKMSCSSCGINVMASMMNLDKNSAKSPIISASGSQIQNNQGFVGKTNVTEEISANELIGLHEYLREFEGDFKSVFKKSLL